jgi:hypothetical protein
MTWPDGQSALAVLRSRVRCDEQCQPGELLDVRLGQSRETAASLRGQPQPDHSVVGPVADPFHEAEICRPVTSSTAVLCLTSRSFATSLIVGPVAFVMTPHRRQGPGAAEASCPADGPVWRSSAEIAAVAPEGEQTRVLGIVDADASRPCADSDRE